MSTWPRLAGALTLFGHGRQAFSYTPPCRFYHRTRLRKPGPLGVAAGQSSSKKAPFNFSTKEHLRRSVAKPGSINCRTLEEHRSQQTTSSMSSFLS